MLWPKLSQESLERGHTLANALLQRSRPFTPPSPSTVEDVKRRLLQGLTPAPRRRTAWRRRLAIAAVLIVAGTAFGLVLDRLMLRRAEGTDMLTAARPATAPALLPARSVANIPLQAAPPALETPDRPRRKPAPAARRSQPKALATAAAQVHAAEPPAPIETEALSTVPVSEPIPGEAEETLLAKAVRALRVQGNPIAALDALDAYDGLYPRGKLQLESRILRVDTLSELRRSDEVLRLLDDLDLGRIPGGLERLLQRARLRAWARRWSEASTDFDTVIERGRVRSDDGLVERALWARATAAAESGQKNAARVFSDEYLRLFPDGRFSSKAIQLREGLATPDSAGGK